MILAIISKTMADERTRLIRWRDRFLALQMRLNRRKADLEKEKIEKQMEIERKIQQIDTAEEEAQAALSMADPASEDSIKSVASEVEGALSRMGRAA